MRRTCPLPPPSSQTAPVRTWWEGSGGGGFGARTHISRIGRRCGGTVVGQHARPAHTMETCTQRTNTPRAATAAGKPKKNKSKKRMVGCLRSSAVVHTACGDVLARPTPTRTSRWWLIFRCGWSPPSRPRQSGCESAAAPRCEEPTVGCSIGGGMIKSAGYSWDEPRPTPSSVTWIDSKFSR